MRVDPLHSGLERWTLRGAGAFGALAVLLCFLEPLSVPTACRLAVFTCLAPPFGCLVFTLLHRITGGQWTAGLEPFLQAGGFPASVDLGDCGAGPPPCRRSYDPGFAYDGFAMLAARSVFIGAYFFWMRWALADGVGSERDARRNPRPWAGPVGLILLFFLMTFLTDDSLQSLEEGWHTTAFTVVWIASQAISGLSLCLLCGMRRGARPLREGPRGRPLGLDWGDLLLASVMFWTYVTFAQFLIIWAGNLPEETSWYLRRQHGGWAFVLPAVALLGFGLPFFMLLSRRLKRSTRGLAAAALLLLAAQLAYMCWVIVPADGGLTPGGGVLVAAFLAGSLALLAHRFARMSRTMEASP